MARHPIHDLPPGYGEVQHVELTDDKLLLRLNLLALIPLAIMLVIMAVWWWIASQVNPPGQPVSIPWWLALIAILLIVLPLHEFIHGLVIMAVGHQARYGMKLSKGVLYATADQALFRRNEYLSVALAPLVGITVLAMLLMLVVPQWLGYYIGIGAVVNAGGAIGDLWAVKLLRHYPADVLIRDEADGFRVYAPGSSTQNTEPPLAG